MTKLAWYRFDLVVYLCLVGVLLWLTRDIPFPRFVWFHLAVFGLAVYRTADVISSEEVTKAIREPFKGSQKPFMQMMAYLTSCSSCLAVWCATVLAFAFRVWPEQTSVVALIFALSACERLTAKVYNYLDKRD